MTEMNESDKNVLRSLVPINALTNAHLEVLLRDAQIEYFVAGQLVLRSFERDVTALYLLSGVVRVVYADGSQCEQHATDSSSRFALNELFPDFVQISCVTDCSLIRFDMQRLDGMLAWDQASSYIQLDIASQRDLDEDADWMLTLLKSNMFYKVPPMNIRKVIDRFVPVLVNRQDTIIRQGEIGDCCYFIKEGSVGVYRSDEGRRVPAELVAELTAGYCFGEDALVNDAPRNATVKMHSDGVLMRLDKKDFYTLLKHPEVEQFSYDAKDALLAQGARWIDVRTQDEFDRGHCQDALHMSLDLLKLKSRLLDRSQRYLLYCNTGRRSAAAACLLAEDGFRVAALRAGINGCDPQQRKFFECRLG